MSEISASQCRPNLYPYRRRIRGYLGDYYQITPGWATARTEWWNMLQRVGTGEAVETAVATFVENANAAAAAEA